ncbi:SDR family oxidoreductase [Vibrio sp. Y2-5]|uniref:SDR family oxidoreductase n=1 Tax=Vibrio TaxID=662 RepID=UPI00142E6171|nr:MULTISPECIES: SDR family oxidoreductase [Vibrio]MBD0785161.1 SDR family oxidoreductase [Vibrio sp. Y2-5]NIY92711.1 SDR family oxidoreductase [Vibrio diazotrophicus]
MLDVKNKNFIVTGATSGIGRLLTKRLVELGANVAFCGRSESKLSGLVSELTKFDSPIYYQAFDATNVELINQFVADVNKTLGSIDVLVNCAGANTSRSAIADLSVDDLMGLVQLNMMSPFVFMKQVYNASMKPRGQGVVINVLSTVCGFSNEGIGAYTASKAGMDALTKVFRKEVRERGVKVCAIYPGGVDTPFRAADRPEYLDPEQVVDAILFMASQNGISSVDELVIRPLVEKNYC